MKFFQKLGLGANESSSVQVPGKAEGKKRAEAACVVRG